MTQSKLSYLSRIFAASRRYWERRRPACIFATSRRYLLGLVIVAACLLPGCTVVGAGVGAALGARADRHHPARGAFFGAAAGAMTGFLFDVSSSRHHHHHDSYCD